MPRPKSYPADLRDRLIHAAAESMAVGTPEELSLRTLAASQDTSTNAIYTLFGGKEQLITAVAQAAQQSFSAAQREAAQASEPGDVLTALGQAYRAWALEHPALYRVMFGRPRTTPTAPDVEGLAPLTAVVRTLMERGVLPEGDPEVACRALWSSVHGWVMLELGGLTQRDDAAFDAFLERLHPALGLTADAA